VNCKAGFVALSRAFAVHPAEPQFVAASGNSRRIRARATRSVAGGGDGRQPRTGKGDGCSESGTHDRPAQGRPGG
jgi:hypothetical protein